MQKVVKIISPYTNVEPTVVEAIVPDGDNVIVKIKSRGGIGGSGNKIELASDWYRTHGQEKELPKVPLEDVVTHIGVGGFNRRRPSIEADKASLLEAERIDAAIEKRFRESQGHQRRRSSGVGGVGNFVKTGNEPDPFSSSDDSDNSDNRLTRLLSRRRSSAVSIS